MICVTVANDSFCFDLTDCRDGYGNLVKNATSYNPYVIDKTDPCVECTCLVGVHRHHLHERTLAHSKKNLFILIFFFTNKIIFEWQNGAITCAKRPEEECEKPRNLCGKKKDGSRKRKKRKRKRKTKKTARKGRTRRRGKTKGRSAGLQLCTIYLSWSFSLQIQFSRLDDKDHLVKFFYTMILNVW